MPKSEEPSQVCPQLSWPSIQTLTSMFERGCICYNKHSIRSGLNVSCWKKTGRTQVFGWKMFRSSAGGTLSETRLHGGRVPNTSHCSSRIFPFRLSNPLVMTRCLWKSFLVNWFLTITLFAFALLEHILQQHTASLAIDIAMWYVLNVPNYWLPPFRVVCKRFGSF